MLRIRSPSILEPRVVGYTLTFITKCILSFQTFVLTLFLTIHLATYISSKNNFNEEDIIRFALYISFCSSVVAFFIGLRIRKWILILPIMIAEMLLLAYIIYKIVDIGNKLEKKDGHEPEVGKSIAYFILCIMVMAECPLTVFLSIRVLLYLRTMSKAVHMTRQLSYVGSITKESLRKEQEMVERMEMEAIRRREEEEIERSRGEPRISVISLPLEERESPSTSTYSLPHIEVSDA